MEPVAQRTGLHHPDFVVMVGSNIVTNDCLSWNVSDREEGKSSIEIELDNLDNKYSPMVNFSDKLSIRFGLMGGEMAPKVTMKLLKYNEIYDKGGVSMKLVGLDDTHQMDNQSGRGQQKGKEVKPNMDAAAKNANIKIDHKEGEQKIDVAGQEEPCTRTPWKSGITVFDQVNDLLNTMSSGQGKSISDTAGGSSSEGANTGNQSEPKTAQQQTASGIQPGKAGEEDKNRLDNARKRADSKTITGKLKIVGYPMIFAKQCITILNVGPKASGDWYVSEAINTWSRSGGYVTNCSLLRDSTGQGKGPGQSSQPMMFYANISQPGSAFAGPRQIDAASQKTFIWGDGNYIIHFDWQIDLHSNKGSAEREYRQDG